MLKPLMRADKGTDLRNRVRFFWGTVSGTKRWPMRKPLLITKVIPAQAGIQFAFVA